MWSLRNQSFVILPQIARHANIANPAKPSRTLPSDVDLTTSWLFSDIHLKLKVIRSDIICFRGAFLAGFDFFVGFDYSMVSIVTNQSGHHQVRTWFLCFQRSGSTGLRREKAVARFWVACVDYCLIKRICDAPVSPGFPPLRSPPPPIQEMLVWVELSYLGSWGRMPVGLWLCCLNVNTKCAFFEKKLREGYSLPIWPSSSAA